MSADKVKKISDSAAAEISPVVADLFDPLTGEVLEVKTSDSHPFIRTKYDPSKPFSVATGVVFPEPSEEEFSALQSDKDACDINKIVARMETSQYDEFNDRVASGYYADLTLLPDFATAQNQISAARSAFEVLPAQLRREFDNDPGLFLDFIDRADRKEFERLGLVPPPEPSSSKTNEVDRAEGRETQPKASEKPTNE